MKHRKMNQGSHFSHQSLNCDPLNAKPFGLLAIRRAEDQMLMRGVKCDFHLLSVPGMITLNISLLFLLMLGAIAYSKNSEKEDKAPEWLYKGEMYGLWYSDLASTEQIERYKAFPFIDWGQPASNFKWVEEFHKLDIRSIAYVSFYKAPNISQVEGSSFSIEECKKNPFWQAVDLLERPGWMLIAQDGSLKRPFNKPNYPSGWYQVCTNVEGYTEAVLEGVKGIMDMGFDGLFIDNVHPEAACFGPEHGKHEHLYPDKNNTETYKMLLAQVRPLVKSYGEDKVCVLNSGEARKEYGQYGDALMWESYIFGGAERRDDWARIREAADEWKPYIDGGKAILALSYIGGETEKERKRNAFYAYACAKLSGFLWAHYPILDRVRIGMPVSYIQFEDGVHYRIYQKGFVAVNPDKEEKNVDIPMGEEYSEFLDLYSDEVLRTKDGKLSIHIPVDVGRIYLSR